MEGDALMFQALNPSVQEVQSINSSIREMENVLGTDQKAAIVDMRYNFIDDLCSKTVINQKK